MEDTAETIRTNSESPARPTTKAWSIIIIPPLAALSTMGWANQSEAATESPQEAPVDQSHPHIRIIMLVNYNQSQRNKVKTSQWDPILPLWKWAAHSSKGTPLKVRTKTLISSIKASSQKWSQQPAISTTTTQWQQGQVEAVVLFSTSIEVTMATCKFQTYQFQITQDPNRLKSQKRRLPTILLAGTWEPSSST